MSGHSALGDVWEDYLETKHLLEDLRANPGDLDGDRDAAIAEARTMLLEALHGLWAAFLSDIPGCPCLCCGRQKAAVTDELIDKILD